MVRPDRPQRWWVALLPALAWGLVLSPLAIWDVRCAQGRATFDHALFHEPTIKALADSWPLFHLTYPDHFVAMTPGYHWLLGGVLALTGMGDALLRLIALCLSVAAFSLLGVLLTRRWCGPAYAAVLLLPVLASMYVTVSAAWLLADNAGWFWVGLLALAALSFRPGWRWALLMGAGLLLAVWTRQSLLFLALPFWAAAWLLPEPANPFTRLPARLRAVLPMAIATIPALASLAFLYASWGAMVPPAFQHQYKGASPSNLALQLAMLAAFGGFFVPAVLGAGEPGAKPRVIALLKRASPWMVAGFVLAGTVSALVPTTAAAEQGRAGTVWIAADRLNVFGPIGESNPLIVLAAACGGAMLAFLLASLPARQAWIIAALYAAFGVAQGASSEVWQRYHEPFALIFLALTTALTVHSRNAPACRRGACLAQLGPIVLLAAVLASATTAILWHREVAPWLRGEPRTPEGTQWSAPAEQVEQQKASDPLS